MFEKRKSRGFLTNPAFATFAPSILIVSPNLRLKSSWPERSDLHRFSSLLRLPSRDLKAVRAITVIKDATITTATYFGSLIIAWKLAAVFL
jgi:hypothetical protein